MHFYSYVFKNLFKTFHWMLGYGNYYICTYIYTMKCEFIPAVYKFSSDEWIVMRLALLDIF